MSVGKSASTIKISSRALLELLSGNDLAKSFLQGQGFEPSEQTSAPVPNPFSHALGRGQIIADISIERSDASDDDWIVIRLEGPDPAVSPFTARRSGNRPKS